MRILFSMALLLSIVSSPAISHSFYSNGDIGKGFSYQNFEIGLSGYLTGTITNNTAKLRKSVEIEMEATNIHETQVHWKTTVHISKIGPYKTVSIREYCGISLDYAPKLIFHVEEAEEDLPHMSKKVSDPGASGQTNSECFVTSLNGITKISGSGICLTKAFDMDGGPYRCEIDYDGEGNFISKLVDQSGQRIPISNEIGRYKGSQFLTIPKAGNMYLEVQSKGSWTMILSPLNGQNSNLSNAPTTPNKLQIFTDHNGTIVITDHP